ncbi:hypothetical protein N7481_007198 [Penicillium waksmanii]|uniref:uncharacterized protein n=1 Tax=Penicillium waksmanii TaxID=69791 RepID=UPI0025472196|nr:uncharacterized protein N7481_007198 [Penicillium waksmanii]KAJ5979900.1 hypothetical protein N7481_007198 [Penicillium waksmanii]
MAVLKEVSDIVIPSFFTVVFTIFAILALIATISAINISFLISFLVDFTLMAIPISLTMLALTALLIVMMALIDPVYTLRQIKMFRAVGPLHILGSCDQN